MGQLMLGGTLQVLLINNFHPALGNTFAILDWGSLAGTFSTMQLPALNNGPLGWDTSQLYTMGTLTVTDSVHGDFNRDGQVTSADISAMLSALTDLNAYTLNNSLSPTQLAAIGDFNSDGKVTNADIQAELDLVASLGGGSVAAVPEPSSISLLGLAACGLFAWRRRGFPARENARAGINRNNPLSSIDNGLIQKPAAGVEPATPALRMRCSAN